jgi:nitronate monooxygenase
VILDEIEHPIVLAPLAGGPATPELAAAVGNAGGLGFLAAGYRTAPAMAGELDALREHSRAPFGVNLFVPRGGDVDERGVRAYAERLHDEATRYGVELGEARDDDDDWEAKLEVLRRDPVPVVSFTFGCPPAEVLGSLGRLGTETWVTVTDVQEARIAHGAGARALVLQGIEAGGHRASFVDGHGSAGLPLLSLTRLVAAGVDLPLIAAGGIGDGPALAAALAAGARAGQVGTAFLRAPEAGTEAVHRVALAKDVPTMLTRAFSGRQARGLRNRFAVEHSPYAPIAYPHVHHLTSPIRAEARRRGDGDGFNLWAGQAHRLAEERPAAEIVERFADGASEALERGMRRVRPR